MGIAAPAFITRIQPPVLAHLARIRRRQLVDSLLQLVYNSARSCAPGDQSVSVGCLAVEASGRCRRLADTVDEGGGLEAHQSSSSPVDGWSIAQLLADRQTGSTGVSSTARVAGRLPRRSG